MDEDLEIETLVANQHREFMAAEALASDLDLAFHLQIQEAMTASLALHPSSSSASEVSLPPPPPRPSSDIALSALLKFQSAELERAEQERRDRAQCEAEMRRLSEDLRLRAHDEKFARLIHQMPEVEWEDVGDEFEMPIDPSSSYSTASSSHAAVANHHPEDFFRLYFKGLRSTETLSAVGVAVCDPQDRLLLKIQKPLYGAGVSVKVIELKALMEGLIAATTLGIKHIQVYCQNISVFNHITGKWAVKQLKVADLVNQALLLTKKFDRCHFSLLPRCHVKFVFGLAKDAINSQIARSMEPHANKNLMETCIICLEDTESSQMFVVGGCSHRFCFSCMKQHVEVKLLNGALPGCPHEGCKVKLNVENSRVFLTPKLTEIMSHRIKEASIPTTEKVYCPYPKCSALMSKSETIRPELEFSRALVMTGASGLRKCIKCSGLFCINCKLPWHDKMSCETYRRVNPFARVEDAKLKSLARQNRWRQCLKCNHMIELAEGCYHMTCKCGYEFCYTCGAEWKNKKATCSCPLWDEENIVYDRDNDIQEEDDDDDDDIF
ncbi:hypothetical protein QJS10_CPB21g01148 [Acorus calamus]|uniref:RBR-type E3 ubiquitin transferase n=1 Tax=Acorus calamus TaxID=4465 RepID=A0AAV9C2Z0_ACOCL|nr:hypothetical protein QJS10_CPB21g01148 [Acorus calamus]